MNNVICTFGGRAYDATIARIVTDGPRFGAREVFVYDEPWLMHTQFYRDNQWAWKHPGHGGHKYGFGWYIWKPYVIRYAMRVMKPGDCLLWLDADTYPIADFSMLFPACKDEGGICAFEATGCTNRQWCKRDVWDAVFPEDPFLLDTQHATARFIVVEKGAPRVDEFLAEWERINCIPGVTTRDPSTSGREFPGFEENRGDQSVFSLLCLKYGLKLHREADAFGNGGDKDRELYGQIFEQKYCQGNRNDLSGSKFRRGPE